MPTLSTSSQVVAELSHTQGSATAPQPQTVCPHQIQAQEAQAASPSSQQAACSTRKSELLGEKPAVLEIKRPAGDIEDYPRSPWS